MIKIVYPCADYIIGTAREIKSLYKNLRLKTNYSPMFVGEPKVNKDKVYGIQIVTDSESWDMGRYMILGETDVCYLLMGKVEKEGN